MYIGLWSPQHGILIFNYHHSVPHSLKMFKLPIIHFWQSKHHWNVTSSHLGSYKSELLYTLNLGCVNSSAPSLPPPASFIIYWLIIILELKAHCCSHHTMGSSPYLLDWWTTGLMNAAQSLILWIYNSLYWCIRPYMYWIIVFWLSPGYSYTPLQSSVY